SAQPFPPIEVSPILDQIRLQSQPSLEIEGAGVLWPAKTKETVTIVAKDPVAKSPPNTTKYTALNDDRLAELVVREQVRIDRQSLNHDPPVTPFIKMLVNKAPTCQLILSASSPLESPRR